MRVPVRVPIRDLQGLGYNLKGTTFYTVRSKKRIMLYTGCMR